MAFVLLGLLGYFFSSGGGGSKVTITGTVTAPAAGPRGGMTGATLAPAAPPYLVTPVADRASPTTRRHMPCDPGPCRRVPNAPVAIERPTQSGWRAEPVAGTTDSSGDFSIAVDMSALTGGGPVFIAAWSPDGTFTFMSTVPADLVKAGATLNLPVDRTTTAAAVMHCPGGTYPPRGGGYCYSDPKESTNIETLNSEIDRHFADNPSTTTDFGTYFPALLGDAHVMEALGQVLEANDLPAVSAQQVLAETVKPPTATPRPTVTTPPTTPRPTSPPPNLPSGFPANLPSGTYSITMRACVPYGGCSSTFVGNFVNEDIGTFANQFVGVLKQSTSQCAAFGASCRASYSAFNGRSFTVTYAITVCSGGQCVTSNIDYVVSKVG